MRIVDSIVDNGCLRIICAGQFGYGSQGSPSGHLIKQAIDAAIAQWGETISEIVIDFTQVEYEWGDGAAAAVLPALRRGLKVSYIASGTVKESLASLIRECHLDMLGDFTVKEAAKSGG